MQKPGLYIHIPFCRSKCPYCDFYSIPSISLISRWLESFKKEVVHYTDRFGCFDSLYLGGGTPTLLSLASLNDILDCLFNYLEFAEDTEITIEANPDDMTGEKAAGLKSLGFNRINLGVQSFNERDLLFLGRGNVAKDAEKALRNLRSSGFDNIGIDLIYGLNDQRLECWMANLKKAIYFMPEHLSCYQLNIEKGTPFWNMKEKGIITDLDEEKECAFFLATSEFLENKGYIHYEVSNFAKGKAYYSRHNCKYWHRAPYLGLGPSAHSFQSSTRWWNYRSVRKYCEALEQGRAPISGQEDLEDEQKSLESVLLGLRVQDGFDLKQVVEHSYEFREVISILDV